MITFACGCEYFTGVNNSLVVEFSTVDEECGECILRKELMASNAVNNDLDGGVK